MSTLSTRLKSAAIIGGGPAGLMAAETLANGGARVHLYDAMPSVGRKFLVAGKGGLNLTHSEPFEQFLSRYGERREQIEPLLRDFRPGRAAGLGGRVGRRNLRRQLEPGLPGRDENRAHCCAPGWHACWLPA